jgi:hypothetical protein
LSSVSRNLKKHVYGRHHLRQGNRSSTPSVKIAGAIQSADARYMSLMAFIAEVENSGMFEKIFLLWSETVNILRHTRYSGSETAYSPYDKINLSLRHRKAL